MPDPAAVPPPAVSPRRELQASHPLDPVNLLNHNYIVEFVSPAGAAVGTMVWPSPANAPSAGYRPRAGSICCGVAAGIAQGGHDVQARGRNLPSAFSTVVWRPRHPYPCSSLRSSASCEATSRSASSSCRRTPAGRSSSRVVPVSVCSSASCAAICSSASSSCRRTSAGRSSSGVMACPLLTLATHAGGPDQVHSVNAWLFSVYAALVPSLVTLALACARSWRQGLRQPGAAVSGRWLLPLPLCSTHGVDRKWLGIWLHCPCCRARTRSYCSAFTL